MVTWISFGWFIVPQTTNPRQRSHGSVQSVTESVDDPLSGAEGGRPTNAWPMSSANMQTACTTEFGKSGILHAMVI